MRLDRLGRSLHSMRTFDYIGVDRTLAKKAAVLEAPRLVREDVNEGLADRLALRLGL